MQDTIYLNQLHTQTLIGILPHERAKKQTLIISLELETDFTAAIASESVNDAINYAALADFVVDFADKATFQLIETFAGKLIEALFAEFNTTAITVTLQKPGALEQTQQVGLKIRREK